MATLRQLANMTSGIVNYTSTTAARDQLINHPAATVNDQTLVDF
ncbi:MAG: hypothetical protein SFU53_00925 [Terrimicrobiaceae bacterium]|nr:hypothetical protein [Terrimicrobiaceae bacterium]